MTKAAADAGRPAPRIVVGLPVRLTNDPEHAREDANRELAIYGQLPSYRAMLDREGAANPGDIAMVGDEAALTEGVRRVRDAGSPTSRLPRLAHRRKSSGHWSSWPAVPSADPSGGAVHNSDAENARTMPPLVRTRFGRGAHTRDRATTPKERGTRTCPPPPVLGTSLQSTLLTLGDRA